MCRPQIIHRRYRIPLLLCTCPPVDSILHASIRPRDPVRPYAGRMSHGRFQSTDNDRLCRMCMWVRASSSDLLISYDSSAVLCLQGFIGKRASNAATRRFLPSEPFPRTAWVSRLLKGWLYPRSNHPYIRILGPSGFMIVDFIPNKSLLR